MSTTLTTPPAAKRSALPVAATLALTFALTLLGCAERDLYHRAEQTNSIGAYRQYVEKYPDGAYVDLAWEAVPARGDIRRVRYELRPLH